MRILPRPGMGRAVLVVVALIAGGCERSTDAPSAYEAHLEFIEAWAAEDYEAMVSFFPTELQSEWPEDRLETVIQRLEGQGAITEVQLTADDVVPPDNERSDGAEEFDYEITYTSSVTTKPISFGGRLPVVFDDEEDRWTVRWERSMLLPGEELARGFGISYRFPPRAPLLDRRGRKLAVGDGEDRSYPFGSVAGTTVGHIAPVARKDLRKGDLRRPGDLVGASGLELAFEERLAGTPRMRLELVGRKREVLEVLGVTPGKEAKPLRTTLDMRIQRGAEAAYGGTTGGAVVLDPQRGDILAVVSSSPFDPTNYVGVAGIEPFNRGLSGLYPPGSSLKVMTAAAALETGEVTPTTRLTGPTEYKGVRNFESGEFGTLTFASAMQNSVNTAFAQVAEDLGAKRLKTFADLFGFNRSPTMPLGAARSSFPLPEDEGDVMWGAIGQAQVLATPLQMATVAATVANHGKRMEPRITLGAAPQGERVIARKTARQLTELMEGVVEDGTGVAAQIPGITVAGKTGTAEVDVGGERKNHAWFISFAPANDPKVVVAVVSEYGGIGGQVAAPLARSILQSVLPLIP